MSTATDATNPLVEAQVVADRLGVPKSWVYSQARENKIPHVPLGRYVRFDMAAIEEWIQNGGTR